MAIKKNSLAEISVLVTRPEMQSRVLCQKIEELGGHALCFPTLAIADPEDKAWLKHAIRSLDKTEWAIFISPTAVLKSIPLIQQLWPTLPAQLKIAAMGRGTARALASFDIPVTVFPDTQFNSEGLLALPEFQAITGQSVVIFQGEGGSGLLGAVLSQRGAHVLHAIAYERQLPDIDLDTAFPEWQEKVDIVISTSGQSLENLLRLVSEENEKKLLQLPLLVISGRMVTLAKNLEFVQPFSAENATDDAVISALIKWKENFYGSIRTP